MNNHATVQSSTPVSAAPLLQVSGALIAIIALILAAAWLVKRLGFAPKRTGVNGLKISASASLGARERVVVVDVEDARLVLGVTAGQINLLHKLPPSAPTEEIPQPDFQSVMKNLLKRSGRSCRTFLLSSVSLPPGDFAVRPLQPAQVVAAHFGCDLLPCGCLVLIGAAFRRPYRPVDSGRQPQCRRFGVGEVGDSLENRLVRLPAGRFRAGRRDEGRRVGTLPVIYII